MWDYFATFGSTVQISAVEPIVFTPLALSRHSSCRPPFDYQQLIDLVQYLESLNPRAFARQSLKNFHFNLPFSLNLSMSSQARLNEKKIVVPSKRGRIRCLARRKPNLVLDHVFNPSCTWQATRPQLINNLRTFILSNPKHYEPASENLINCALLFHYSREHHLLPMARNEITGHGETCPLLPHGENNCEDARRSSCIHTVMFTYEH